MIEKLNKQFNTRYQKELASLNKNIYKAPKDDSGNFEVPVVTLGTGGGTVIVGNTEAFKLKSPAMVKVENKKMKPYTIVYRVAIPYSEAEIAADKPEYFNYFFDAVILKALANFRTTVGDENKIRFGDVFVTATIPESNGDCLRILHDNEGGDYVELRLFGCWASDEVAT